MTIWDNIYKNYQKTGKKWATIEGNIHELFPLFLKDNHFPIKSALDIGCGEGKYLYFLQKAGFKLAGIDSSRTAVAMTKKLIGLDADIKNANMFFYKIPKNKYDLILSTSTIHHGTKKQISNLINAISGCLMVEGSVFITILNAGSRKNLETFRSHKKIAPGTYAPQSGPEKGLPHSFYTKKQAFQLFSKFKDVKITADKYGKWLIRASKTIKNLSKILHP